MNGQNIVITEYLLIRKSGDKITYKVTVLGQNESKPLDFVFNESITDKVSFENQNHGFPQKIQYTPISKTELFVEVLGGCDKGFSYKMIKQGK